MVDLSSNIMMDEVIDTSYDEAIQQIGLPWLPWVGKDYKNSNVKTLILGESVYNYRKNTEKDSSVILERENLRRLHMNHGVTGKYKDSRYLQNFQRAALGKKSPSREQVVGLWKSVAYHNLVLKMLPSRNSRPSKNDYIQGWEKFLELSELLKFNKCIVYGLEYRKIDALLGVLGRDSILAKKKLPAVGRNQPYTLKARHNDKEIDFLFIRHPSAFFSWKDWREVIHQTGMLPSLS